MSASNDNWVCFACRRAVREDKTSGRIPKCPSCKADLFWLGYKVEVPKKNDVRRWRELQQESRRRAVEAESNNRLEWAREKREAIRRVEELESLPQNKDRQRIIDALKQKFTLQ